VPRSRRAIWGYRWRTADLIAITVPYSLHVSFVPSCSKSSSSPLFQTEVAPLLYRAPLALFTCGSVMSDESYCTRALPRFV
jgi:hypothetical protein